MPNLPNIPKRHADADNDTNYYDQKGTLLVNLDYIRNRIVQGCLSMTEMRRLEDELLVLETAIKWR